MRWKESFTLSVHFLVKNTKSHCERVIEQRIINFEFEIWDIQELDSHGRRSGLSI